jgi:hypothetical protein
VTQAVFHWFQSTLFHRNAPETKARKLFGALAILEKAVRDQLPGTAAGFQLPALASDRRRPLA